MFTPEKPTTWGENVGAECPFLPLISAPRLNINERPSANYLDV